MNLTDKSLDKKEGFKKTGYKTGQGKEKKKLKPRTKRTAFVACNYHRKVHKKCPEDCKYKAMENAKKLKDKEQELEKKLKEEEMLKENQQQQNEILKNELSKISSQSIGHLASSSSSSSSPNSSSPQKEDSSIYFLTPPLRHIDSKNVVKVTLPNFVSTSEDWERDSHSNDFVLSADPGLVDNQRDSPLSWEPIEILDLNTEGTFWGEIRGQEAHFSPLVPSRTARETPSPHLENVDTESGYCMNVSLDLSSTNKSMIKSLLRKIILPRSTLEKFIDQDRLNRMLEGFYVRFTFAINDERCYIGRVIRVKNSFETLRNIESFGSSTKWIVLKVEDEIFEVPLNQISLKEPTDEELESLNENIEIGQIDNKLKVLEILNTQYTQSKSPHLWRN